MIPDNLKVSIYWLLRQYQKVKKEGFLDRWDDFQDFVIDWYEIGLTADSGLTEDAKDIKNYLWKIARGAE